MSGPLNWLMQVALVTRFSLQSMRFRLGWSASAVFGIAGVVAVLVGVFSIALGFQRTLQVSATEDGAIVLRSGASTEMMSGLLRDETRIVAEAPQVARRDGDALSSAELFVIINLPKRSTGTDANVPLRGVEPAAFRVRDDLTVTRGRAFEWGRDEVIVGAAAAAQFAGLDLGNRLTVGPNQWTVVGIFTANGAMAESEIWSDAGVLQSAYRRGNTFQSVRVRLDSADAFQEFKDALTTDPRLSIKVQQQSEYYSAQSAMVTNLILYLGVPIVLLMSLGAVFGAVNTMYTAVSARTREIATLRALGFRNGPVVLSVLIEAVFLAILGGVIGGGVTYLGLDGFQAATMNWTSFSQIAFAFDVTPGLLLAGIVSAALIGLVGGLYPAVRAARLPIASALREP